MKKVLLWVFVILVCLGVATFLLNDDDVPLDNGADDIVNDGSNQDEKENNEEKTDTGVNDTEDVENDTNVKDEGDEDSASNGNNGDSENENEEDNEKDNEELVNGMRKEFKEAMDSYEAFFDEYCNFIKTYATSDNPLALMNDYLKFMEKYEETMSKLDEIDEEELNDAELKYYTEVMMRINQKLYDAAQ